MQLDTITSTPRLLPTEGRQAQAVCVYKVSRLQQTLPLTLALFALWVVLSGKFDAFHLLIGAGSALCISLGTHRLLLLPPAIGPASVYPVRAIPWFGLLAYLPWLGWQIVLASVHIAFVVLHPRMPISPRLVRFRTSLPHTLARLTLATSITLTPGTVTLDVQDDEFLVHALTEPSARGLAPEAEEGTMQRRVAALYSVSEPNRTTGVTT
jgi:multicomponent Na+:H+ antiporter subunit E